MRSREPGALGSASCSTRRPESEPEPAPRKGIGHRTGRVESTVPDALTEIGGAV